MLAITELIEAAKDAVVEVMLVGKSELLERIGIDEGPITLLSRWAEAEEVAAGVLSGALS